MSFDRLFERVMCDLLYYRVFIAVKQWQNLTRTIDPACWRWIKFKLLDLIYKIFGSLCIAVHINLHAGYHGAPIPEKVHLSVWSMPQSGQSPGQWRKKCMIPWPVCMNSSLPCATFQLIDSSTPTAPFRTCHTDDHIASTSTKQRLISLNLIQCWIPVVVNVFEFVTHLDHARIQLQLLRIQNFFLLLVMKSSKSFFVGMKDDWNWKLPFDEEGKF